jgi:hypothetical protein
MSAIQHSHAPVVITLPSQAVNSALQRSHLTLATLLQPFAKHLSTVSAVYFRSPPQMAKSYPLLQFGLKLIEIDELTPLSRIAQQQWCDATMMRSDLARLVVQPNGARSKDACTDRNDVATLYRNVMPLNSASPHHSASALQSALTPWYTAYKSQMHQVLQHTQPAELVHEPIAILCAVTVSEVLDETKRQTIVQTLIDGAGEQLQRRCALYRNGVYDVTQLQRLLIVVQDAQTDGTGDEAKNRAEEAIRLLTALYGESAVCTKILTINSLQQPILASETTSSLWRDAVIRSTVHIHRVRAEQQQQQQSKQSTIAASETIQTSQSTSQSSTDQSIASYSANSRNSSASTSTNATSITPLPPITAATLHAAGQLTNEATHGQYLSPSDVDSCSVCMADIVCSLLLPAHHDVVFE